ncbi:MAG: oxalyl-CoA decarboxylase [Burkholderiaceae bacterium]|nr:oxalyl-CoA decarboxylase [Burkholderiaceae bacterium]
MSNEPTAAADEVELTDGFHLLIDALKMNGINTMYGLVGIPVTNLARAWLADGQKFFAFRHEQAAGIAAQVHGYLTKTPGVCLTVSAPGFLNGLTACANATTNCWPMILISGSSEREIVDLQQGDYEEMDQLNMARPFCKAAFRINRIQDIPVAMARAVRTALSGRPGAVYLDIPARTFGQTMPMAEGDKILFKPVDPSPAQVPGADAIKRAVDLIKGAKKPLVLFGKGASYAQCDDVCKAFIEETGIPFTPMSMAKGLLPDNHPLCGAAARSFILQESDVVILVGARLNWLLAHGKGRTWGGALKKFVQIDIQGNEMDSNVPIAAPLVGDVESCLNALRAGLKGYKTDAAWTGAITERVAGSKAKLGPKLAAETPLMNYSNSLAVVRDMIAANPDIVLVNEGANALDNTRMIVDMYKPRKRVDTGTWGIMGLGGGAVVGAANATGQSVISVQGDSAFGFSGMEIETAVRYNLPICFCVINNGGIYKGNEAGTGPNMPSCVTFTPGVRYDKFMEAMGGTGYNVTTPAEFKAALSKAVSSKKPSLINVVVDPDAGVESGRIQGLNIVSKVGKRK